MMRKLFILLIIVGMSASISACGRKNAPVAPEGADPNYPRTYPAPVQIPTTPR